MQITYLHTDRNFVIHPIKRTSGGYPASVDEIPEPGNQVWAKDVNGLEWIYEVKWIEEGEDSVTVRFN